MINSDFKFDLAGLPRQGRERASEIARRDSRPRPLPHRRSNRRSAAQRRRRARQRARRGARASSGLRCDRRSRPCSAEHRLAALAYPTLRRKPARIGDGQAAPRCQVSAHSRPAGARRAGRLHRRRPADRHRPARRRRSANRSYSRSAMPWSRRCICGGRRSARRRSSPASAAPHTDHRDRSPAWR